MTRRLALAAALLVGLGCSASTTAAAVAVDGVSKGWAIARDAARFSGLCDDDPAPPWLRVRHAGDAGDAGDASSSAAGDASSPGFGDAGDGG